MKLAVSTIFVVAWTLLLAVVCSYAPDADPPQTGAGQS